MIVIPKEIPIISNLNSYYLKIDKLFEHYQGIVDSGCMYFKSPSSEGVVYFDEENLINGVYQNKKKIIKGKKAIELLMGEADINNFLITIYEIIPERITFWANLTSAEILYKDLSTEFTDLDGLKKKMVAEKLTGFIEVNFSDSETGIMFFLNGELIGSSSSEKKGELMREEEFHQTLIQKSSENPAMLSVKKVSLEHVIAGFSAKDDLLDNKPDVKNEESPVIPESIEEQPLRIIEMLQQLMFIYEKFISGNKKISDDFDTLLKRKFMEKLDKFDFLDPFAAEFEYSNGNIVYSGREDETVVADGLIECLMEIAEENNMQKWLSKHLLPWKEKYSNETKTLKFKL